MLLFALYNPILTLNAYDEFYLFVNGLERSPVDLTTLTEHYQIDLTTLTENNPVYLTTLVMNIIK